MSALQLRQVETTESVVEIADYAMKYWEAGVGDPIVLLHRGSGPLWSQTHDLLSERHRVIMLEQPGFGASDAPAAATTREYAALVHAAALSIAGGPYTIVGNSFGGLIAVWIAVQYPDDILAMVLLSPAVFMPQELQIDPTAETFDQIHLLEKAHPEQHYPQPLDRETKIRHLKLLKRYLVPDNPELVAGLANLRVPTLVSFGTEDRVIPPEFGRKFPALNPAILLSFIYDAGHASDGDRPESVAHTISLFTEHRLDYLLALKPRP